MSDQMVVPFGKYAGQPVEVLQNDPNYCNWLLSQNWFREKYAQFNTLIINNFAKPEDTPEHNELQATFLSNSIVEKLIKIIEKPSPQFLLEYYKKQYGECLANIQKQRRYVEACGTGKILVPCKMQYTPDEYNYSYFDSSAANKCRCWNNPECPTTCTCYQYISGQCLSPGNVNFCDDDIEFEVNGWDVVISGGIIGADMFHCSSTEKQYFIEVKPCLGDDYPSILRQMKANSKCCHYKDEMILIYKDFTASGATIEQVKCFFMHSNIKVLSFHELEGEE